MEKIPLCLIGCGGMGHRHILAYKELEDSGIGNIELVGVCDLNPDNADLGKREVERLFGRTPLVFNDLDGVVAHPDIAAVDVVTDPSVHHQVAVPVMEAGKHVLCEKPLGITIRACQAMIGAAEKNGVVLATAENLRRDPPNRLARGIIDQGLLGDPYLMIHNSMGGSDRIYITPWRHMKDKGALGLDMAVHYTDIVQYYMGEYDEFYGMGKIVEPVRYRQDRAENKLESYTERFKTFPESIEPTGEDAVFGMYKMKSGAMVQFSFARAGRGGGNWDRSVHGRLGTLFAPGDRNGKEVILKLEGRELAGEEILSLLPDFQMSEITARVFGEKMVTYDPAEFPPDAKHMAIEMHDFGEAVLKGTRPEVDGYLGMTAVAAIYGVYESGLAGRPVTMDEMLSGQVRAYQEEIDAALGLD